MRDSIEMKLKSLLFLLLGLLLSYNVFSQCGGQLEPGFTFLTSSRGCAPFTVRIETLFLGAVPGTSYRVNWGDGTALQTVVQTNATGVILTHTYPVSPVQCGYDVQIDAFNACNPLGSVVPVLTQVVVWNEDVVQINPAEFRVCQGFATTMRFTDNSAWNCFPRATRENNAARWLQWQYGVGPAGNQLANVRVNGILPGGFPYLNPAPNTNPGYPFNGTGNQTLPITIPVTTPAEIGREFVVRLRNWNQCNAYDDNLADGNPFNPVNGNLITGDNPAQVGTARIVIVPAPQPNYQTRLGNAAGPLRTIFCVNDNIYFQNLTPAIGGANFAYRWEFFDNPTGTGVPIATRTGTNPTFAYANSGVKMIRLYVRDQNAFGNCENVYESTVTITPVLVATIRPTDLANNIITPNFCQNATTPLASFDVRFHDVTPGVISPTTEFRWEVYDQNNVMVFSNPAVGFSSTQIPFIDRTFVAQGQHRVRLIIRDNSTSCQTIADQLIRVTENPVASFMNTTVCETNVTRFINNSTHNSVLGDAINRWEWDLSYDNVTFTPDPAFNNQTDFQTVLGAAGVHRVALRVTTSSGCSDMIVRDVTVLPLPIAQFTPDVTLQCSGSAFNFLNQSIAGQPDLIDSWTWEIDRQTGLGFQIDSVQRPTDPGFSATYSRTFTNNTTTDLFYLVRLRVRTVSGCETVSLPVTIQIAPAPTAGFTSLNYFPFDPNCAPVNVIFQADINTINLNPSDYTWTVTDQANNVLNTTSTGTTPNFTFLFPNTTQLVQDYRINLRTSFPSGCSDDSTRIIRVNPVPLATFTIDTISIDCEKMRLRFSATQLGLIRYNWQMSENGVTIVNSDLLGSFWEYEFTRQATNSNVSVQLQTTNFANCVSNIITQNTQIPALDVFNIGFTALPISQFYPNTTVTINNTSNSNPNWTYTWTMGDGTTVVAEEPGSHTYTNSGTYTITLNIDNGYCSVVLSQNVTILPAPSSLDFTFNPSMGCSPLVVNFTSQTLNIQMNTLTWQIGNQIFMSQDMQQIFTSSGNYDVTLTGRDINGTLLTITKTVNIVVYEIPNVLVIPTSQTICDGSQTSLVLYNTNNVAGTVFQWTNVSTNVTGASTATASSGPIVDQLHLIDPTIQGTVVYTVNAISNGCMGNTQIVTVYVNPTPIVSTEDATICSGEYVNIPLTSNMPNTTFNWQIGNITGVIYGAAAGSDDVISQQLQSDQTGGTVQYIITPVISGCAGTPVTSTITVNPSPVSRFTVRSFFLMTNDPLYVRNVSESATSYHWDFGDGTTSTEFEPVHLYEEVGQYSLFLIAYNSIGCADTSYLNAYIQIQEGGKLLIPNVFTPSGGTGGNSTNDFFKPLVAGETEFNMQIYNRWGTLMFETNNSQIGWDGKFNDKLAPPDIYVYKISVKFQNSGNPIIKTGDFLLLR